ncbi:hypothetical protein BDV95DRAFT_200012 [Massariosphaeria phaeospora]|uniref:Uncharacterized protein n=1 Tax=Massariosphaeria phaeospora TaxID=100035 RepID=A0A7C8MD71_9PLEO|nr:hypothetical protein BDV95DRAFT_200012 [Massariosphaeria phaeospora]
MRIGEERGTGGLYESSGGGDFSHANANRGTTLRNARKLRNTNAKFSYANADTDRGDSCPPITNTTPTLTTNQIESIANVKHTKSSGNKIARIGCFRLLTAHKAGSNAEAIGIVWLCILARGLAGGRTKIYTSREITTGTEVEGQPLRHTITNTISRVAQTEIGGSILADEMGMGKCREATEFGKSYKP